MLKCGDRSVSRTATGIALTLPPADVSAIEVEADRLLAFTTPGTRQRRVRPARFQ
jgi:hypothetical protein